MVIEYKDNKAIFKEICAVEEAETLLEWMQIHPQGEVDLKDCQHLHSAVLQVLMAAKPRISNPSSVPFITQWLLSALMPSPESNDRFSAVCRKGKKG